MMREVSEHDYRVVVHKSCGLVAQTFYARDDRGGVRYLPDGGLRQPPREELLNLPRNVEINMVVACGIRKPGHASGVSASACPSDEVYRRV